MWLGFARCAWAWPDVVNASSNSEVLQEAEAEMEMQHIIIRTAQCAENEGNCGRVLCQVLTATLEFVETRSGYHHQIDKK